MNCLRLFRQTPHLDLRDGGLAHRRVADAEPREALLGDRSVEHTFRPKLVSKPNRAPENASKRDILPEQYLRFKTSEKR